MGIVFYKSKEHPDFYMVYKGRNGCKPEEHIKRLTNTCGFENSGYLKIEIEIGFVIKTDAPDSYFNYQDNISKEFQSMAHMELKVYPGKTKLKSKTSGY